jgi:hypothetical protein
MTLRQWDVHYFFNPYTKPAPKNKFIVVAYVDQAGWFYGLYVNSRVARFVQSQPALLPCMAELLKQALSCLGGLSD